MLAGCGGGNASPQEIEQADAALAIMRGASAPDAPLDVGSLKTIQPVSCAASGACR